MIPPVEAYVTVEEISNRIAECFRVDPEFDRIRVLGEINDIRNLSDKSKHLYFKLRSDNDQEKILDAVWFSKDRVRYSIDLKDGDLAIVEGRIAAYEKNSTYQIIASAILPLGNDNLETEREERWRRLEKEGLFGEGKKRPIPYMPEHIGVVCSRTSAAFKDIESWFRDYYPSRYELTVKSVKVQGEGAAREICAAIEDMSRVLPRPEVIIVARGGGADEDLSVFDNDEVVRAVARSEIPLISGVGHEPDRTLIDFAADLRVPTPTAAAAVLQLEDRRRAGREFSSESESELKQEQPLGADIIPDLVRRFDATVELLEDVQKLAHDTKDRVDELDIETGSSRGGKARTLLGVAAFSLLVFLILLAAIWPISDTWVQWPEWCQKYVGWAPVCK